jgi:hypothetical protein
LHYVTKDTDLHFRKFIEGKQLYRIATMYSNLFIVREINCETSRNVFHSYQRVDHSQGTLILTLREPVFLPTCRVPWPMPEDLVSADFSSVSLIVSKKI